jgi:acetylornithine/N-succinyldiaminopimelate aminotransferase
MRTFDVYPLMNINPERAKGSWLWDKSGTKYLDLYGGHAVISIGHSHPLYIERLTAQLQKIAFYSNSVINDLQEELAFKLGERSGYHDYSLFMCNSGAEANENALKLASFHTGRKKVIAFEKSFHGRTSLAVAATNDRSIQAPINASHEVCFLPLNDEQAFTDTIDEQTAAVIIEGIQGVGGIRVPENPFLQLLRQKCDEAGAVLILDEVQSGYGRTGKFFAHQHASIRADLVTVAKGMANGFPAGGLLISPSFKSRHGLLGTTFGGNHLACAAAIAVLDVISEEDLVKNANDMGQEWIGRLSAMEGVKEIRGKGLMIGIEFDFPAASLRTDLAYKHHILTGNASNKNMLRLLPALNITAGEMDLFNSALEHSLTKHINPVTI